MTIVEHARGADDAAIAAHRPPRTPVPGWWGLAGLLIAAGALYTTLAIRSSAPTLFPDEFRYTHLAKSLADGQGFTWRGDHIGQSTALYIYLIAPIWRIVDSTSDAYNITKALGALTLTATAIPTWLLARQLLHPRLALLTAALSIAGTWMLAAAMTVTEVIAYPLATAALCTTAHALRRPGSRLGYLALTLALLATWARIQLIVLIPTILAAYALDPLRTPTTLRHTLHTHRHHLQATAATTAALALVALLAHNVVGDYIGLYGWDVSLPAFTRKTTVQLVELTVAAGLLPLLLAAAAACSRSAWRDPRTGPLLLVFWLATLALCLQSGWYIAGAGIPGGIERYVTYPLPLAYILMATLLSTGAASRRHFAIMGALAIALLAVPAFLQFQIEPATSALSLRAGQLTGLPNGAAVLFTAIAMLAACAVLVRRTPRSTAAMAACLLVLAALVVQSQAIWHHVVGMSRSQRAQLPPDVQWLDHHAGGPVAVLTVSATSVLFNDLDFFNRGIDRVYTPANGNLAGPPVAGGSCTWQVEPSSALDVSCPGSDGRMPHRFFINDPSSRVTFRDEVSSVADDRIGRLVKLSPTTPPRVESILLLPCPTQRTPEYPPDRPVIIPATVPVPCRDGMAANLWLDRPGDLIVRFAGGARPHAVRSGERRWTLPPGVPTTVRVATAAGASQILLETDWRTTEGSPRLVSVQLDRGGRQTELLR